jgi:hypothetical protein
MENFTIDEAISHAYNNSNRPRYEANIYNFILQELRRLKKIDESARKKKERKSQVLEAKKNNATYLEFVRIYIEWMREQQRIEPDFSAAKGKQLKEIIAYFIKIQNGDETKATELWMHILYDWNKLSAFLRKQTDLSAINRNKQEIITQLKDDKNKPSTNNRDQSAVSFMESLLD